MGDYVVPASTVLAQSPIAEGSELFTALLAHLSRGYTEVYGSTEVMGRAPERREIQIGEGGVLSGGNSVHSRIKLGAYTGRFTNISLEEMNNPSSNLTTV